MRCSDSAPTLGTKKAEQLQWMNYSGSAPEISMQPIHCSGHAAPVCVQSFRCSESTPKHPHGAVCSLQRIHCSGSPPGTCCREVASRLSCLIDLARSVRWRSWRDLPDVCVLRVLREHQRRDWRGRHHGLRGHLSLQDACRRTVAEHRGRIRVDRPRLIVRDAGVCGGRQITGGRRRAMWVCNRIGAPQAS